MTDLTCFSRVQELVAAQPGQEGPQERVRKDDSLCLKIAQLQPSLPSQSCIFEMRSTKA